MGRGRGEGVSPAKQAATDVQARRRVVVHQSCFVGFFSHGMHCPSVARTRVTAIHQTSPLVVPDLTWPPRSSFFPLKLFLTRFFPASYQTPFSPTPGFPFHLPPLPPSPVKGFHFSSCPHHRDFPPHALYRRRPRWRCGTPAVGPRSWHTTTICHAGSADFFFPLTTTSPNSSTVSVAFDRRVFDRIHSVWFVFVSVLHAQRLNESCLRWKMPRPKGH